MSETHGKHRADGLPRAFVVGCMKSGTTWMQGMLEAHPEVCSRGEAAFAQCLVSPMIQQLNLYNKHQRAGETNTFSGDDVLAIVRFAINTLQRKWVDLRPQPDRVRVIAEKTPEHAGTLDMLGAVFPQMRVIHIIRDGRDALVSGWHHNLREKGDVFRAQVSSMASYARYFAEHHWVPNVTRARDWGDAHPSRYLELRYEQMLDSTLTHARRIFGFLGVDTSDELLGQVVDRTSFSALSGGRKRGEVDNASHFRKGTSGGWRDDLDPESIDAFESIGGELLDELGYPRAAAMSA